MNLEDEVSRGIRAQELLDNSLFTDAFAAVEKDVLRQMDEVAQRVHARCTRG